MLGGSSVGVVGGCCGAPLLLLVILLPVALPLAGVVDELLAIIEVKFSTKIVVLDCRKQLAHDSVDIKSEDKHRNEGPVPTMLLGYDSLSGQMKSFSRGETCTKLCNAHEFLGELASSNGWFQKGPVVQPVECRSGCSWLLISMVSLGRDFY